MAGAIEGEYAELPHGEPADGVAKQLMLGDEIQSSANGYHQQWRIVERQVIGDQEKGAAGRDAFPPLYSEPA